MHRITSEKVFTAGLTCPKLWGSIKSESSPTSEAITRRSGCINNLAGQSAACLHADYHIKRISGSSTDGPIQMQTISCNIYKDKQPTTEAAQLPHWAVRVSAETGISPEYGRTNDWPIDYYTAFFDSRCYTLIEWTILSNGSERSWKEESKSIFSKNFPVCSSNALQLSFWVGSGPCLYVQTDAWLNCNYCAFR